jgi:hypothetical protein
MHMQRQHRQCEANDQECDRDHAHDREHGGHRMAVSNRHAHGAVPVFRVFDHVGCARAFGSNRIRPFRGGPRGRRVYGLILKHGRIYRG